MSDCRSCGARLNPADVFCDLGTQPLANALVSRADLDRPEVFYPLRPLVCRDCLLVQLPEIPDARTIFGGGYPFYAGQSSGWVEHCERLAAYLFDRCGLYARSRVLEVGSNDGTLLAAFRELQVPALGVEPCREVALSALRAGLATDVCFFDKAYARGMREGGYRADLVVATNVLAHVPDPVAFLGAVRTVLADEGTLVIEVPYVGNLIAGEQYDQVYAEHHCYFSAYSLGHALWRAGLAPVGIDEIPTHGGSIRVYCRHTPPQSAADAQAFLHREREAGLRDIEPYLAFAAVPAAQKRRVLRALYGSISEGERVVGYGASAKAAVAASYLGLGPETIEYVVDTTPAKQGKFLPGSRIPIVSPLALAERPPDMVVNFLWNWREESERNIREATDARIFDIRPQAVREGAAA